MITIDQFIGRYYSWLKDEAFVTKQRQIMYGGVLDILFDIPFYWSMELDGNRADDASVFRRYERYRLDKTRHNVDPAWLDRWEQSTPSVLEVFIGICERWSQFFEKPNPFFFNHLFRNMGFYRFRGETLRSQEEEAVRWSLDNWMSHQIERNGDGSPFPLKYNRYQVDLRTSDIWGQMSAYSMEHFM